MLGSSSNTPEEQPFSIEDLEIEETWAAKHFEGAGLPAQKDKRKALFCLKDQKNYLIGGAILDEIRQVRDTFKIFKNGKELYSHILNSHERIFSAVFIKRFNSYFLIVNESIYRKDINQRAPYHYMKFSFGSLFYDRFILHHPSLKYKAVMVTDKSVKMINLLQKKINCSLRLIPPDQETRGYPWEAVIFGKNRHKLAVLTYDPQLILIDFKMAEPNIMQIIPLPSVSNEVPSGLLGSLAVSSDHKYLSLLFSSTTNHKSMVRIFEVIEGKNRPKVKIRKTLKVRSEICVHSFFTRSSGSYLFFGF